MPRRLVARAGRDGLPADCLLFFNYADTRTQQFFIEGNHPPPELIRRVYHEIASFGLDKIEMSARELNEVIHSVFKESQVYRIDHYLGKETVQNVLVFRFANGIFEPIWNRRYVDHIQITVAEDIGIERRGKYYETAGALRDIFQNHLLQLLSIAAMEAPANFDADTVL